MISKNQTSYHQLSYFIILFLILPIVLFSNILDFALIPRYTLLSCYTLFLGIAFVFGKKSKFISIQSIIEKPVIFYFVFVVLSGLSIFQAINLSEAFFEWFKTGVFFLFFFFSILLFFSEEINFKTFSRVLLLASAIILSKGIYELVDVVVRLGWNHQNTYLVTGFFTNRNFLSEYVLLLLPLHFLGVIKTKSVFRKCFIVFILIDVSLVFFLLERTSWIALAIASTIIAVIYFVKYFKNINWTKTGSIIGLAILALSITFFSLRHAGKTEMLEKQFWWVKNLSYGSSGERLQLWNNSVKMINDHPVLGIGAGNWKIVFPSYGVAGLRTEQGEVFFQRPHNDYIGVLCETGFAGFLVQCIFLGLLFFYAFRLVMKSEKERFNEHLTMLSVILLYAIISLFSFPKERIEHFVLFNFAAAWIVAENFKIKNIRKTEKIKRLNLYFIPVAIFLTAAIYAGIQRYKGERYTRIAFEYRAQSNWLLVSRNIDKAFSFYYTIDPTATPINWYSGSAYFNTGNTEKALAEFETALIYNPYHIHVLNNLGTCYETLGDHEKSILYYNKAIEIAPHFKDALLNLCAVDFNLKKVDEAFQIIDNYTPDTSDIKYTNFLQVILKEVVLQEANNQTDKQKKEIYSKISINNDWIHTIYLKSKNKNTSFKNQLKLDADYVVKK